MDEVRNILLNSTPKTSFGELNFEWFRVGYLLYSVYDDEFVVSYNVNKMSVMDLNLSLMRSSDAWVVYLSLIDYSLFPNEKGIIYYDIHHPVWVCGSGIVDVMTPDEQMQFIRCRVIPNIS